EKKPEIARFVSDRHFGIGSDGIIFINSVEDEDVDFEMEMYNADGSRSEMCGNGIRCVAKYVYDKGLTSKKNLVIVSAGKKKYIDLTVDDSNKVSSVKVDMGAPILEAELVPVDKSCLLEKTEKNQNAGIAGGLDGSVKLDACIDTPIEVDGRVWNITCVSMGNPHAVVFLPDDMELANFDIEKIGPKFENHKAFPRRTNTEFVKVDDRENVHMRVWERGTGETQACGTGCSALTVAGVLNGYYDRDVSVEIQVLGGVINVNYASDGHVYMTGPATTVYEGVIEV
ncbi:MAG: diaminopimelate epimerase, partial [Lachnospiraceae bacterium]|nr:diaminopimelate epimerase [Lachnospiraceae bacterium]